MSTTLDHALAIAEKGYRVHPIPPGCKYPKGFPKWQENGTSDTDQIIRWWDQLYPDHGICWLMGTQDNGQRLVAVDVDDWEAQATWLLDQRLSDMPSTVRSRTGRGGMHYIYLLDDDQPEISNGKLVTGVDIRGEGGQIVIPPSVHPDGNGYQWVEYPTDGVTTRCPDEVVAAMQPEVSVMTESKPGSLPISTLNGSAPSVQHDNPADWVRENYSIPSMLNHAGWTYMENDGDDQKWCRPEKDPRNGLSAILHGDAPLVVWSTSVPMEFWRAGRENRDGSRSLSPLDVYAAINHAGDTRRAASYIRTELMPRPDRAHVTDVPEPDEVSPKEVGPINLPDSFWSARPELEHIRQGAWHRSCSPDAVLAGVMARYSAQLPPSVKLPNDGTLDLFFVIQGHSGSGKSKAGKCARALYPGSLKNVVMDAQVGSGEGLAEVFFEYLDDDDQPCSPNKKDARKVRTKVGLHFATDEGQALVGAAGRASSILIPTLCSAWMGETIGHVLADPTKSRLIPPMTVRVAAEVRIQTLHGYKLFQEEYSSTGLSQRMLCVPAVDPSIFERFNEGINPPSWPGELTLARPPLISGRDTVIALDPEIEAVFLKAAAEAHNPAWQGDPLDTHSHLSALKCAAIFALWDGRRNVNIEDWELAQHLLSTHRANRSLLKDTQTASMRQLEESKIARKVREEVAISGAIDEAKLVRTLDKMRALIAEGKYPSKNQLTKPQRELYDEARQILEDDGEWPDSASRNPSGQ